MEKIEFSQIAELFESVRNIFSEKKDELCDMDARLGDGDLGLTMSKGFGALPDIIRAEEESAGGDVGKLIMKAGMKMSSLIPSTMGFLMSSGIMEGGKALKGRTEIDAQALADYIEGFAAGIQKRGKCSVGECTIYDAIEPAARAAKDAAAGSGELESVIDAAVKAAGDGVEATKNMSPMHGKSAVHAVNSAGIADQGAVAGFYKLSGMRDFIIG